MAMVEHESGVEHDNGKTAVDDRLLAVDVREVRKSFGTFEAVRGVSFSVPEGSFTTLLGASGSGKSTTLRLLAGLESPDGGEIRLGSTIVSSHKPFVFVPPDKRRLGFVFQSYALWPHMKVFDQVAYPLRVRGQRAKLAQRVEKALALVGLSELGARYPAELSGGQQQRVALARAIVYEPEVLLLDEPLSNLDAELREYLRNELQLLHRRLGITMVYVTHDQHEALSLSDHIIVMHEGNIIEQGSPTEIYEHPKSLETASFVGASNMFPGVVEERGDSFVRVKLDCGFEARSESVEAAKPLNKGERVVAVIKPEDVLIDAAAAAGSNRAHVTVETVAYLGQVSEVAVRIADQLVRVRTPKSVRVGWGDKVEISFPATALRVFPAAAPAAAAVE
jgi:iron(III) transport system ATP-binding protein